MKTQLIFKKIPTQTLEKIISEKYLKPTHNCCDHAVPEISSGLPSTCLKVSLEIRSPCFSATVPLPKYVLIDPAMFGFQTLLFSFDHPVTKDHILNTKFRLKSFVVIAIQKEKTAAQPLLFDKGKLRVVSQNHFTMPLIKEIRIFAPIQQGC